jgi:hypothetical protein
MRVWRKRRGTWAYMRMCGDRQRSRSDEELGVKVRSSSNPLGLYSRLSNACASDCRCQPNRGVSGAFTKIKSTEPDTEQHRVDLNSGNSGRKWGGDWRSRNIDLVS